MLCPPFKSFSRLTVKSNDVIEESVVDAELPDISLWSNFAVVDRQFWDKIGPSLNAIVGVIEAILFDVSVLSLDPDKFADISVVLLMLDLNIF